MPGIRFIGTGSYCPDNIVTNRDFEKFVETSDEWIRDRTGIRERRISTGEPAWYMGREAGRRALEAAGVDGAEIDAIIACTVTPDFTFPSLACILQAELGADRAFCYDLNAACSGFVYALDAAYRLLITDGAKKVLIVCSEVLSRLTDFTDRSTCVLFGDGAAAALLVRDDAALFYSALHAEGASGGAIRARTQMARSPFLSGEENPEYVRFGPTNEYLRMDGREVYRFATRALPAALREACEKAGLRPDELDLIVPHQANIRIIQTAAKELALPMERFFINLDRYGNTASASVPICLDELSRSGALKPGMKLGIAGFGGGLTYASAIFEWRG